MSFGGATCQAAEPPQVAAASEGVDPRTTRQWRMSLQSVSLLRLPLLYYDAECRFVHVTKCILLYLKDIVGTWSLLLRLWGSCQLFAYINARAATKFTGHGGYVGPNL